MLYVFMQFAFVLGTWHKEVGCMEYCVSNIFEITSSCQGHVIVHIISKTLHVFGVVEELNDLTVFCKAVSREVSRA